MTGEQAQAPATPRDGDDIGITIESPKVAFTLLVPFYARFNVISEFYWPLVSYVNFSTHQISIVLLNFLVSFKLLHLFYFFAGNGA
jgi:hypothetical protein